MRDGSARAVSIAIAALAMTLGTAVQTQSPPPQGQSFTTLYPKFTQQLFGVTSNFLTPGGYLGGVVVLQNGDVIAAECVSSNTRLHRFASNQTAPGTGLHVESIVNTQGGCGVVLHPDGFIYSNRDAGPAAPGIVKIDPQTGETKALMGPPGNALGIAVDPKTNHLVYAGRDCRAGLFGPTCTLIDLDPLTGLSKPIKVYASKDVGYIGGLFFDPTGEFIFINNRWPTGSLTIAKRDGSIEQQVPLPFGIDATGVAFHARQGFVVTNNTDGSMSLFRFPENNSGSDDDDDGDDDDDDDGDDDDDDDDRSRFDYDERPTEEFFAAGGFRGDLMQVGPDGCLYATQAGTRYDDFTETTENSIVRLCGDGGFVPPHGVTANPAYEVALTAAPASVLVGQPTRLTATVTRHHGAPAPTSYAWDCGGDGIVDATTTVNVHTCSYAAAGAVTASVVASSAGVSGSASTTVTILAPPASYAVVLAANPATVTIGQVTTLTATATPQNGAPAPTSYEWDCDGNGKPETMTATNVATCTYTSTGTKVPRVVVRSAAASGSASTTVVVTTPAPSYTVALVANPATVTIGQATTLTATARAQNGAPAVTAYDWDCDGNGVPESTTGTNTRTCTYASAGVKAPRVTARSAAASGVGATTVTVTAPAPSYTVSLVANPAAVVTGQTTTLTATAVPQNGAPAVTAYDWDCDADGAVDATTSANTRACTFTTIGTKTPRVTARSAAASGSASTTVTVAAPPPPPAADLALTLSVPAQLAGGTSFTYTFTAVNLGPQTAAQATFAHTLPANATVVKVQSAAGWTCATGAQLSCTKPAMAGGESAAFAITVALGCGPWSGKSVPLAATISSTTADPKTGNNTATASPGIADPKVGVVVTKVSPPELWPPNHRMEDVAVDYVVTGACATSATVKLTIASNQKVSPGAMVVVDTKRVRLQASRDGKDGARVYTITIAAQIGSVTGSTTTRVVVPHDMRK